jgi:kelch-like protein 10
MEMQVTSGQFMKNTRKVNGAEAEKPQTITEMEAKSDICSSQKYECGYGDTDWLATLALRYFSENNLHSDAVLSLEDGGTLPVNRKTLSKCSEYFRTLFTTKLYSPERTEFFPLGVSTKIMTQIRDYAYYGTVDIDEDNVCELLKTSDYLRVPDIVQMCCDFLKNNLDPENCIGVMLYARFYFCSQLESNARSYLMRHFVKEWQQSVELLELPVEELQAIVGADELNVKNEKIVWECVLRWIDHDTDNRKGHIVDLLKNVRLGLLDRNFLNENVICHPHVAGDEASRPVITEVLMYLDELETMTTDEEIPTPKFALKRVHDILFVIGGTDDIWGHINYPETYCPQTDRWTKIEAGGPLGFRKHYRTAVIGFDIYLIGGYDDRNKDFRMCYCFNAVTKTWRDVAPMKYCRYYPSVAVLGDVLYVMCGQGSGYTHQTAERYDPKTERWSRIADMTVRREGASATALNGKIYVVGGYHDGDTLRSAEVYDPRTNRWTLISDMRIGRYCLSCIAFHGCVYAIAGMTNHGYLSCGEKYDPETDTWSPIPDMSMRRSRLATAVIDDKIFVIGGSVRNGTTNSVECFNDEENEWCEATGMSAGRIRPCAAVVSGLPNVNDYIGRRKRQK